MIIFTAGSKVQGSYYGVNFTGTVESRRTYTVRNDSDVVYIDLDTPLTVLGATRETISMTVKYADGKEISGDGFLKLN